MSSAAIIAEFGENVTRRRFSDVLAPDAAGEVTVGAFVDTDILAVITPLRGKELLLVPEGERLRQWKKIHTEADLRTAIRDVGGNFAADRIILAEGEFEVRAVENWPGPLAHLFARAVAVNN